MSGSAYRAAFYLAFDLLAIAGMQAGVAARDALYPAALGS